MLLTPDEVAAELRCTRSAVYRWIAEGRLKAVRVGSLLRVRPESIEAFVVDCADLRNRPNNRAQ